MMKYYFLILAFISLSCVRKVTQGSNTGMDKYEEDLSTVRPVVTWDKPVEPDEKEDDQQAFIPDAAEPSNENQRIAEAMKQIASYNAGIQEAAGFRIQLFSGNNRGDFEKAKSYVLQHFPELELYESYSQPTYRLKVGDFLKRMDAERYFAALSGRFSSSKIVTETIDVQKGFNIN